MVSHQTGMMNSKQEESCECKEHILDSSHHITNGAVKEYVTGQTNYVQVYHENTENRQDE